MLTIMVLLSAAMIGFGDRAGSYLRTAAAYLVAPLGEPTMYIVTGIKGSAGRSDRQMTAEEAEIFLQQARQLENNMKVRQEAMETLRQDLENFGGVRLAHQFNPDRDAAVSLVQARVLGEDSLPYSASRLLRVSRKAGTETGQAVVTKRQLVTDRQNAVTETLPVFVPDRTAEIARSVLVGRLGTTSAYTAQLILTIDPSFKTEGAAIRRVVDLSNPRSILVGGHERPLRDSDPVISVAAVGTGTEMEAQAAAEHKIAPGDLLVLPVARTYWPAEVLAGVVTRVDESTTGFDKLHIRPAADLSALRDVYVLVPLAAPAPAPRGRGH